MADLPTGVSLGKISIPALVMVFVIYLAIHLAIAVFYKKKKEELDNMENQNTATQEYLTLTKNVKLIKILYNWFPAIALVIILVGFYL